MKGVCAIAVIALATGSVWGSVSGLARLDTGLGERGLTFKMGQDSFLSKLKAIVDPTEACKDYSDFWPKDGTALLPCNEDSKVSFSDSKKATMCFLSSSGEEEHPKKVELQLEKASFKFIVEVDSTFDLKTKTVAPYFDIAHYIVYFCAYKVEAVDAPAIEKAINDLLADAKLLAGLKNVKVVKVVPPLPEATDKVTRIELQVVPAPVNGQQGASEEDLRIPALHYKVEPSGSTHKLTVKGPYLNNSVVYTIPNMEFVKKQTQEFLVNAIHDYARVMRFVKNYKRQPELHHRALDQATILEIMEAQLKDLKPQKGAEDSKRTIACVEGKIQFELSVAAQGKENPGPLETLPGYSIVQFLKQTLGEDNKTWTSTGLEASAMNLEMVVPQTSYYDHEPFLEAFAEDVIEQVQAVCPDVPKKIE